MDDLQTDAGALALTPARHINNYRLADNFEASDGQIFITGTQALVRLHLMQRSLDKARGYNTAGFISGYRGSPLGAVDQQVWKAKKLFDENDIHFLPAVNEELASTAVLGTQRLESDSERRVDGVFAMWYGKGPGVDRAADSLKHGNAYGSSKLGGVLVVAGDDHGCASSSMSHQSDYSMMAWHMPIVSPANVTEIIEFGLYGWALSRFSGAWVGLKAVSENVETGGTVNLDDIRSDWKDVDNFVPPEGGLHNRWPDFPSMAIERRHAAKFDAVRQFARVNSIDKWIAHGRQATIGIVTSGKAHFDFMESLRRLKLSVDDLEKAGVRIYKIGLIYPLETTRIDTLIKGLTEILVIEEKGPVVEGQLKDYLYNRPTADRPAVLGKTCQHGRPLLSDVEEMRSSRLLPVLAAWLAQHKPQLDRCELVPSLIAMPVLSNKSDAVRRVPYFCSGCPHNTSTKLPEGSIAYAGIGCHFMASWMDRKTSGLIQMGGEGVDWVAQAPFTKRPHIFQNLGDGTYFHSGLLAIRQAIAAKTNITYKILHNHAVAMTGGQPVDGHLTVPKLARQLRAEGINRIAVISDDIDRLLEIEKEFPAGASFHDRDELNQVQTELRDLPGVTALIYDQGCAAEKRRLRKKGQLPAAAKRVFINEAVCEGCGDCGVQSNCLSVTTTETALGRKRKIDQSSCNMDLSCVAGTCPSFVTVDGAIPRKSRANAVDLDFLRARAAMLPLPSPQLADTVFNVLVTGVGGSGVVTVGALICMAAHLEGHAASVLDFMGFSQKGGAVLSHVRLARHAGMLNQVRIDTQQADVLLACDAVVAATAEALQAIRHGWTQVAVNLHAIENSDFVRNPDADLKFNALLDKLHYAAGHSDFSRCDAQALAEYFVGDTIASNIIMLGLTWQQGWIPVSFEALMRAIELNGVAVEMNKLAFSIGRLAAADPAGLDGMSRKSGESLAELDDSAQELDALIGGRAQLLQAYGGESYVQRYLKLLDAVRLAEGTADISGESRLTRAVAVNFAKLLMVKDEYEVARLYSDGSFHQALEKQFEGVPGKDYQINFHFAPPVINSMGGGTKKFTFRQWMWPVLKVLSMARPLRESLLDPFRHTAERKLDRELANDYEATMKLVLGQLSAEKLPHAVNLAELPASIRGYGHVKLKNMVLAKARERELSAKLGIESVRSSIVVKHMREAASNGRLLRGIPVVNG
ncbi:indolepyruvate ferredoxin oxidoreductase family protein [Undibacterium sp. TS12]|uniref:indolepyruvate ferredoxin oxidoreductase family protein n=1 Tax=Undibacterium sp. TS12 TaxID=2908202 RepID=UPI001F4D17D7|nr:indolepyruvate ferredoxin oxidoreductase family protein [Undibacterium sp. TS12]MCH8618177.1 indolepyruvate ferredoxin oxidoreductase family protein [Undibacterium sp. TS12]